MFNRNEPGTTGDVQTAIAAGAAIGEARSASPEPGSGVYTIVPDGYELQSLEDYLPNPLRIEQRVAMHDADSFIAYVNVFIENARTQLFFDTEKEQFVAILDYHENPESPGWCDHIATFTPRRSVEFQTWMNQNRKQMTQVDFARFLEENMPDVVEPNSAEMLQVALTFEAKKSVEFFSGVRLANGQIQLQYDEVIRGAAQKGAIEIPEKFVLGIPIHVNGPAYRIDVRLRWRLQEGKVGFWYEIVRPHRFIEDALKEIRGRVAKETGIDVLSGAAQ